MENDDTAQPQEKLERLHAFKQGEKIGFVWALVIISSLAFIALLFWMK